jgi:glyoxylase-like metal-dependent hydrolase (beta-lactamase superfamily II)
VKTKITAVADHFFQIPLTPPLEGYSDFISAWLVMGRPAFLVDVGPSSTADQLLQALEALGVHRLDYILLTHIHLDHAGAIGQLSRRFPLAKIVCHENGISHLVDPARLWEGTCRILGPVALGYGPLQPVPAERFIGAQSFCVQGITAVPTPGHAPHHISYATEGCLFAGETCGVWYDLPEGRYYLRPATPPKFFMNLAIGSIDALISRWPTRMVVGHFGMTENGGTLLGRHRDQLVFWEKWIRDHTADQTEDEAVQLCMQGLLAEDPLLEGFSQFSAPVQDRERYFLKNSLKGFLGWISAKSMEHGS